MKIKSLLFLCLFRIIGKHLLIETEDTAEAGQVGSNDPGKGCLPQSPKSDDAHPLQMLHLMSTVEATWKSNSSEPTTTSRRRWSRSLPTIQRHNWSLLLTKKITKAQQAPCPLLPRSAPSAAAFKVWSSNILLFPRSGVRWVHLDLCLPLRVLLWGCQSLGSWILSETQVASVKDWISGSPNHLLLEPGEPD